MISIRLESLVKHVDYTDKIIDIGCDHALLDINLIKNKCVKSIIASDIHIGALNAGKENVLKANLNDKIDLRLGNGLEVLTKKDKIDTILISGMGTNTILGIINNPYFENINKLILQSNNDHSLLRTELIKKGFIIKAEDFIIDNNKHYINIVFVKGNKEYSKDELRYGPILIHNKTYLNFELDNCNKIYNLIPKSKIKLRFVLMREIKQIKKLINK